MMGQQKNESRQQPLRKADQTSIESEFLSEMNEERAEKSDHSCS